MLDAALVILERDGLQGPTIAAVAKEAGVGIGTIYHRFKDRMGLVIAAEDRFLRRPSG
jgi:AcrR family transcriptional regulator